MTDAFYHESPEKVQEIIFYVSSRLHAATLKMLDIMEDLRDWRRQHLVFEIVMSYKFNYSINLPKISSFQQWALSFVGMATAIGMKCEIPLVLHNLASFLYRSSSGFLIFADPAFRAIADIEVDPDDPAAPAESYLLPWWTYDKEPEDDEAHYLKFSNLDAALEHHKTGKLKANLPATAYRDTDGTYGSDITPENIPPFFRNDFFTLPSKTGKLKANLAATGYRDGDEASDSDTSAGAGDVYSDHSSSSSKMDSVDIQGNIRASTNVGASPIYSNIICFTYFYRYK